MICFLEARSEMNFLKTDQMSIDLTVISDGSNYVRIQSLEAKNRVFELDYQKSVQCSKN